MLLIKISLQWYDRLNVEYEFKNGFTLNINTFVHIWQMISVSPFANAVCYIDKTINTAVATVPNEVFDGTADTDTREYKFVDSGNAQVKLMSLDQLEVLYISTDGRTSHTVPNNPPILTITDTNTLKIAIAPGTKRTDWASVVILFGEAVIDINNSIA